MIINIILLTIIGICLFALATLVIKKFPAIAAIDVTTIPEEKEAEIKHKILTDRLSRKTNEQMQQVAGLLSPVWKLMQNNFRGMYQRAVDLERKYKRKYQPLLSRADIAASVQELLDQATESIQQGNLATAEKQYIEILSLDARNYEAYKGLADLYIDKNEHEKAQEVLTYLIRLNQSEQKRFADKKEQVYQDAAKYLQRDLAEVYIDAAQVENELGNLELAAEYFEAAVVVDENNPRFLTLLLEQVIQLGKKVRAVEVFDMLKAVNPDNQKLEVFGEQIKEMTY